MGGNYGCGCKEVYRFPTPLVSALFCSSIPTFCSFFNNKIFFVFVQVLFCNLCKKKIAQYKHIWTTMGIPRQPYEGLHIMSYTQRSTQKRTLHILRWTSGVCLQWAGCRFRSRGRSRGRNLELEGGVKVSL